MIFKKMINELKESKRQLKINLHKPFLIVKNYKI